MKQSGLDVYNNRKISNSGVYSFENDTAKLTEVFESMFQANEHAWEFFRKQAPSYQKAILRWIMSAKQESTRLSRLTKTITACENKKKIY